jgi:hypothetical protein
MDPFTKPRVTNSYAARHEFQQDSGLWARYTGFALGAWLLLAAFVLPHGGAARANTALSGGLIALANVLALRAPQLRRAGTLLGTWLFFSTLWFHRDGSAPVWNDILGAIVTFVLSLVPSRGARLDLRA